MGDIVSFPSNGSTAQGYLATAAGGSGPGVIVIQEWWGLVPHIESVVDRFAAEGFTALAPDLYHGQKTTEPDEAGKLMMALNMGQAAKDISGAIDYLVDHNSVSGAHVGIVGYCMGGGLALYAATLRPDAIKACAPYYGLIPWPDAQPDWSKLDCVIRGHYAENDGSFPPAAVAELQATLTGLGKDAVLTVHPGTDHAFFNDTRPEVYDAEQSATAFADTVDLFRTTLG
jgi:carboxymethylenebutenolidase